MHRAWWWLATCLFAGAVHADPGHEPPEDVLTDDELLAQSLAAAELIEIDDRAPSEAASSVHFSREDLRRRPAREPSDLLRQTPGLVVAQHAGGGKADQYFLRGFDADHGTDVALFVDGVPVNLSSHGHGQGYADAHWIIPETIASLDVHKGPYAARYGDYYTAGAIELRTIEDVERPTLWLTGGTELAGPVAGKRLSSRLVGLATPRLAGGASLFAAELGETDGPFISPQGFRRGAAMGTWKRRLGPGTARVASTFYVASWSQSGQIPAAEVAAGRLDRFGAIDPSEGGDSQRASLATGYVVERGPGTRWKVDAYAVRYQLQLFSNFTLFARDAMHGDQIEQTDERMLYGASGAYQTTLGDAGPVQALLTAGVQTRLDQIETGLWHTASRRRLAACFDGGNPCNRTDTSVLNAAAYVEGDIAVKNRLHILPGMRVDQFAWRVDDRDPETDATMATLGGSAARAIASPKLSIVAHATKEVHVFANGGRGFHSNDARAAVGSRGDGALAAAWGAEVGTRLLPRDGTLEASLAVWYLHLASEQVWSGDFGTTEPAGATRRHGIEAAFSWKAAPWLAVDGNVAVARAKALDEGTALALAPRLMGGGGVTVHRGAASASLRARGIDQRPANEDGSLTADGYLLVDVVATYPLGRAALTLTVNNLLDATWREAQFAEVSRPTPAGDAREDVHFTPGMPLTALLTVGMSY